MANCKKCIYFVPIEEIDNLHPMEKEKFEELREKWLKKRGEPVGFCTARQKPVYYVEGPCKYYVRKQPETHTLEEYGVKYVFQ